MITIRKHVFCVLPFFYTTVLLAETAGNLSLEKSQRLNSAEHEQNNDSWVGLNIGGLKKREKLGHRYTADMRFLPQSTNYAYSIPEAYVTYSKWQTNLKFGRQIVDWNPEEKFWMMNNINGLKGFNLLSTDQEGLLGVHIDRKVDDVRVRLLGSMIYIPSMNPKLSIKDGTVSSQADWVKTPPKYTRYNGVVIPLYYKEGDYNASDIVLQETLGVAVDYDSAIGNLRTFGLYKPENDLKIGATAAYNQDLVGQERIDVTATPAVNHHFIYGMNYSNNFEDLFVSAGYQSVNPNTSLMGSQTRDSATEAFDSTGYKINPTYQKQDFVHSGVGIGNSLFSFKAHYLQLLSDNSSKKEDMYSGTVKWERAVGSEFNYKLTPRLVMDLAWRYDMKNQDNLLKGEMGWKMEQDKLLLLGVEMLESPESDSYWSAYRANDTIYSRFSLLF